MSVTRAVPRALAAAGALLCIATFLVSGVAAAAPAPTPAASPASPARAVASSDAACTLHASLTHPSGELGTCLGVGASLSTLPLLGGTATLTVTVRATRDLAAIRVTVDLPTTLAFADGTANAAVTTGEGTVHRATIATLTVAAGSTHTVTRHVRAVATGFGAIVANATGPVRADDTNSGSDSVFLTVGRAASRAGADVSHAALAGGATTSTAVVAAKAAPMRAHVPVAAAAAPSAQVAVRPATAGTSCVTGHWYFTDRTGATVGGYDTIVEVMRGTTVLTVNSVAYDGSYTSCFASGGTAQTVFVKFLESNNAWRVTNTAADTDYSFKSGTVTVADGTTYDLGGLLPTDVTVRRAVHAYWYAAIEYDWIYSNASLGNGCWSPYATTCQQLVIHWQADATDGPVWRAGQGAFLPASTPDYPDEPVHEYGHALMYGLYGNTFPSAPNCHPHHLNVASSAGCGWTEGFADWVTTAVWNHTLYTYGDGSTYEFNTTWGDGGDNGDQVEGRVVQAMDSLLDGVKAPWDNDPGLPRGRQDATQVFRVMQDRPWDFSGFWADWANIGYEDDAASLGALYQGTIDYGFRNPLADGQVRSFPIPYPGNHNYSFTTTQSYWSVVAVQGDDPRYDPTDVDLSLFTDAQQTNNLGTSDTVGKVDFVAINSNSDGRALQTYYPRVTLRSGSNLPYQIMARQGASVFSSGTLSSPLGAGQPFANWDTYQRAGVPVYIRAIPVPGQTVGLSFLQPGAGVVARPQAANSATTGAGEAAQLVVTPTATGFGGLVLTNEGLTAGAPWVYEDTTAPTGTLSVDGGASTTTSTTATLALSASDPDTGVDSMQISTDGTFDTEPVRPYATSARISLDDQLDGDVNVSVRYHNQAGMWSAPITTTIDLEARPTITSVTPNAGPRTGGTQITIHGRRLTGIHSVTVGNVAASQVVYVDDSTLFAVVPAHAPGTFHVRATVQAGSSVPTAADQFTYYAPPTVTSISPATGPRAGGTLVTVNGTDFVGVTNVVIGTTSVSCTVLSPTQLQFTTPAGTAKRAVRVTAVGGTSPNAPADVFIYR